MQLKGQFTSHASVRNAYETIVDIARFAIVKNADETTVDIVRLHLSQKNAITAIVSSGFFTRGECAISAVISSAFSTSSAFLRKEKRSISTVGHLYLSEKTNFRSPPSFHLRL